MICILYNERDATYTMFFIIISALVFFRPSSGAYKTVCAALGIVTLSCCLPLVWMGWPIHTSGRQHVDMPLHTMQHAKRMNVFNE
jgi:hypothetical protein